MRIQTLKRLTIIAAIGALTFFIWPRSSDPVRERIESIAGQLSFEGQLHPIAILGFARTLSEAATNPLDVYVNYQGKEHNREISREELVGHIAAARRELSQLAVTIKNLSIVRAGADRAQASMQVRGMGKTGARSDYFLEIFDVKTLLKRTVEHDWQIERIEAIDQRDSGNKKELFHDN